MTALTSYYEDDFSPRIKGLAKFCDDIKIDGILYAGIVRSNYAHAKIIRINAEEALKTGKVVGFFNGKELANVLNPGCHMFPRPNLNSKEWVRGVKAVWKYPIAVDKVRYVGEPVAVVVCKDLYDVEDVLEKIDVEYEPLPPVLTIEQAIKSDHLLYEELGDNIAMDYELCSVPRDHIEKIFANAEVVVNGSFKHHRLTAAPIEPRGIIASYDASNGTLTIWSNTQNPLYLQNQIAYGLSVQETKIKILSPAIGGAFGVKTAAYDEDFLIPAVSMLLHRPVKWIETRREHMLAAGQAREQIHEFSIAAQKDGKILALRDNIFINGGAVNTFWASWLATLFSITGPYKITNIEVKVKAFFTNKAPYWACRGFGKYDAAVALERMIDRLAYETNLDPVEVRLRNLIQSHEMPYKAPTGALIDSGDFEKCIKTACQLISYDRLKKSSAEIDGKRVGVGVVVCLEPTGVGSVPGRPGAESVRLSIMADGEAVVRIGTCDTGQSHKSAIKKLVSQLLSINPECVKVIDDDTFLAPLGLGPISCRFSNYVLPAVHIAARKAREKILKIASTMLEISEAELEISDGKIFCIEDPDKYVTLGQVAFRAYFETEKLPEGVEPGLEFEATFRGQNIGRGNIFNTYPFAVHAAQITLDDETGVITIDKYVVVHDCGNVIDEKIVENQGYGSLIQGLGGALLEEIEYSENGTPLTSTFADYLLPSACEYMNNLTIIKVESPTKANPLGLKGAGETNTLGPVPVLAQAIENALSDYKVFIDETPLKPNKIWSLIQKAKRGH